MTLEAENIQLKAEIQALKLELQYATLELFRLKNLIFGRSSERSKSLYYDDGQMKLFEDEQVEEKPQVNKVKVQAHEKTKVRKKPSRVIFPADLPREDQILNPEGVEEDQYEKIGEDITEILAYKPGEIYVKRITRPKWVCKKEAAAEQPSKSVLQQEIPPRLIPKGMVDESLVAHIIEEKFLHHTPVYRLISKYKQIGINFIKSKNLHNWIHRSAEALMPLHHLLRQDLLSSPYLQGDESTLKVLQGDKPGASHTGYMWLIHNPENQTTLFHYDFSRQHRVAHELFGQYGGILQADGYEGYESVARSNPKMKLINCMAHARRKFVEASNSDPPEAKYYLSKVGKLYYLEKQLREENADYATRYEKRQEIAVPILAELKEWMNELLLQRTVLPKSPLGKAIAYSMNRWEGLCAYTQDGKLEIDNNYIENMVRPLALGRKNYLFAKNHDTAQNLACLYSIIITANNHRLCIHKYLEWLLRKSATEKMTDQAANWLPHKLSRQDKDNFLLK
ncbi:MAG TPA: IS66 family transposase [Ginsengibacter sp.]|nr:IS66 family transposase [Ginsengibacter sp.]